MSLIKSADAPKAAKLVVAIVAVFGLAAWRVAGAVGGSALTPKAQPAPAATEAAVAKATLVGETATPPKESAAMATDTDTVEAPKPILLATLDPFRSIHGATPTPTLPASAPTPQPLSGRIEPQPLPVSVGTVQPLAQAPVAATPRPAPVRLTGIVSGPQATAVLWVGDEERVVRVGSHLPDGSVVARIDRVSLVLRLGSRQTVLSIEG